MNDTPLKSSAMMRNQSSAQYVSDTLEALGLGGSKLLSDFGNSVLGVSELVPPMGSLFHGFCSQSKFRDG